MAAGLAAVVRVAFIDIHAAHGEIRFQVWGRLVVVGVGDPLRAHRVIAHEAVGNLAVTEFFVFRQVEKLSGDSQGAGLEVGCEAVAGNDEKPDGFERLPDLVDNGLAGPRQPRVLRASPRPGMG